MACNFTINFQGPADAVVDKAKQAVQGNGGTFNGDDSSGSFSIPILGSNVAGQYTIAGEQMAIEITHKPFFASCGQIQSYIESHM